MNKIICLGCLIVFMMINTLVAVTAQQNATPQNNLISLELKDTPVRTAIDSLFKGTGMNYAIEPGVTGTIPNLSLKDVTFDQALKTLTKAAGLTYRKDGSVYLIGVKQETPQVSTAPTTPEVDLVEQPVEIDRKVDKIALNYADATDIAAIFGGQAFSSRSASLAFGGGGMGGMGGGMRGGMGGGMMGGMGGGMMGGMGGGMMGGMGGGGFGGGGFGGGGYGGGGYGGGGRIGF